MPEKRREGLRLLEIQQTAYTKTMKRGASLAGLFTFFALILWKTPALLGYSPKAPLLAELMDIAPVLCVLVAGFVLVSGLNVLLLSVGLDSQIRCLQLADYIDEKSR